MINGIRKIIIVAITTILLLGGCSVSKVHEETNFNQQEKNNATKKITAEEAKEMIDSSEDVVILDVRELEEYKAGHIKDSILLPLGSIESNAEKVLNDKDRPILVYCKSGRRSAEATKKLSELGYSEIYDFGGINEWKYEVEK